MSSELDCILPVAGYGSRFLPITKTVPKELLPILSKPLIQYSIEESLSSGTNKFIIITSKEKKAIQHYLSPIDGKANKKITQNNLVEDLELIISSSDFKFIEQEKMLGLGHAIYLAKNFVKTAFSVILPDDFCITNTSAVISQMKEIHEKNPECCIVAVEEVSYEDVEKYGIVEGVRFGEQDNLLLVENIVEKPKKHNARSNLAVIGRYILTQEIFSELEVTKPGAGGEIQITDALSKIAKKGKVLAYKFDGKRIDCGSMKGFVKANNLMSNI